MSLFASMLFVLFLSEGFAQYLNVAVPHTLADRDGLMRLEVKVEKGFKAIDERFKTIDAKFTNVDTKFGSLNKRMDDLLAYMIAGFGAVLTVTVAMFSFVVWDRVSFAKPIESKIQLIQENAKMTTEKVERLTKTLFKRTSQKSISSQLTRCGNLNYLL